jgi:hypothetical protein
VVSFEPLQISSQSVFPLSDGCSQKIVYKVTLTQRAIEQLLTFLMKTRTDAHYTRINKNASLTKVAKPASIEAGKTGLKINDLRRA